MNQIFLVTWEMHISADSPEEAAAKAWQYMRAQDSTANAFKVIDDSGATTEIDLSEESEA